MTDMENKILGGFIRLLENHPIEQITVTEICKESGVSKRSFYNYYYDKYDVILKVQAIPEMQDEDTEVSLGTFENYFRRRYRWLLEHRGFLKNISLYFGQNSSVLAFRDSVIGLLWKIMRQNHPDLQETPQLTYAVNCFACGYLIFLIEIILRDPAYCEAYFQQEHFIEGYIPSILLRYLT
ncbi:MAG: TetR/AcrR family transcriptional regulator [Clostridia bacterium]|nr:TetR/AcrR family transcriptional regulator [Clostridia bacterium]